MSDTEVWLIAGGEPGTERLGQLLQTLRKAKEMSVGEVAEAAGLSVGTIRAIEQGRRAPSQESGVRLLKVLLPEDALQDIPGDNDGSPENRPDVRFTHPQSGFEVLLEFKARTAGDNRRWASDKPPAGETAAEARLREFLDDPIRMAEWHKGVAEAMQPSMPVYKALFADIRDRASRPASDADFGKLVRRLATADEFKLERVQQLLDIWDRAAADTADERARDHASRANRLLDEVTTLFQEDLDSIGE